MVFLLLSYNPQKKFLLYHFSFFSFWLLNLILTPFKRRTKLENESRKVNFTFQWLRNKTKKENLFFWERNANIMLLIKFVFISHSFVSRKLDWDILTCNSHPRHFSSVATVSFLCFVCTKYTKLKFSYNYLLNFSAFRSPCLLLKQTNRVRMGKGKKYLSFFVTISLTFRLHYNY